jgi:hypothetical protein
MPAGHEWRDLESASFCKQLNRGKYALDIEASKRVGAAGSIVRGKRAANEIQRLSTVRSIVVDPLDELASHRERCRYARLDGRAGPEKNKGPRRDHIGRRRRSQRLVDLVASNRRATLPHLWHSHLDPRISGGGWRGQVEPDRAER